ncbi:flagellar hook-associated protein FlgK [Bacillus sp. DTU_2020_1000418_1_SI_GHA_SEK_038]|uniref:flagellar hook-associated protein FlgK n=1 Tax=Bacillus sp. DTU_2020_1000418_1_SI_GHA_SEK_038 TaxID=3077585 RepID=UPI0028E87300|nr:flagellar hook-associated protein FlgK [Bacillus sp. DTU_2020_1000418_1_SI_GHA_SEK_038]WNS75090.1 flagellar hook-associated protein FlgK [Bacillus sp. DTU_2020_1000418_1_SI_GHA_SEK_038]
MMISTFHGLETARRGMSTQQNALFVTGHNIANANTPGYSRQRVNFVQTEPFPAPAINRPQIPGQMGTGVKAGSIQRIREAFLDVQYRNEQNKLGYWESKAKSLSKMEDIVNEPSTNGLSAVMGEFWQSLQDLATYPENEGTRQVVLERGRAVADTFHFLNDSLTTIKNDLGNEVSVNLKEINSLLKQIADLNKQIGEIEPHGYLPNDLYDQRDLMVDQLSNHLNIRVVKTKSGGKPQEIAEGQYNIKLVGTDGKERNLVTADDYVQLGFAGSNGLSYDVPPDKINTISIFDDSGKQQLGTMDFVDSSDEIAFGTGKLRALIESYGYETTTGIKGTYPDMLDNLDKLAFSFANIFNEIHSKGYNLDGDQGSNKFFTTVADSNVDFTDLTKYKGAAKDIILGNLKPSEIAASTKQKFDENGNPIGVDAGDGKNALNLANISNMLLTNTAHELEGLPNVTIDLQALSVVKTGTLNFFYEGMIGQLGVESMQANRLTNNSTILRESVENNRNSVSSVSLDEEMTNLIKFQHAYNASARQITVIDEMLDKIINGMGVVGR